MRYGWGLWAPLLLLFPLGCAKQFPADYAASRYTRGQITGEAGPAGDVSFTPPRNPSQDGTDPSRTILSSVELVGRPDCQ